MLPRRSLLCAIAVGVVLGVALTGVGLLAAALGWVAHDPWDIFATGFVTGFVAALVGVASDYGDRCKPPASAD